MAFWLILIKIVKALMTIRKYAGLLSALSSGKLVESIFSDLLIGYARDHLVKAGIPLDRLDFEEQAKQWIENELDGAAGDLSEHAIVIAPGVIRAALKEEMQRLLTGKSMGNGLEATRNQGRSGDPIVLHRGEFEHVTTDLSLNGAGIDLAFRRTYRSGADYLGPIGRGWDHSFNLRLIEKNEHLVARFTGRLGQDVFYRHPRFGQAQYGYFAPPNGTHDILVPTPTGSFRIEQPGGGSIAYERCGPMEHRAILIKSPGSHVLSLQYDADDRLTRLVANSPGRYIDLSYDSLGRIAEIRDHTGRSCEYEYDEGGLLISARQAVVTEGKSRVDMELYEYTLVGQSRRLARICDEEGVVMVENVYDCRSTSETLGYVIEQTLKAGRSVYSYEPLSAPSPTLSSVDAPTLRVFEWGPDGHVIERIFNEAGNELLRREDYTDGGSRRTALFRKRYNSDGAVIVTMDPEGELVQYLYGREQVDTQGLWSDVPNPLLDATASQRMAFGNKLSSVHRAKQIEPLQLALEQEEWLALLPPPKQRMDPQDVVSKYQYAETTQQLIARSDPQHTVSPDPLHVESAPMGTPLYDPSHVLALNFRRHLTTFHFDSDGVLLRTNYPDRAAPASAPITEQVLARDAKGRSLQIADRRGYVSFHEHYPESGSAPASEISGFLKRRLLPHLDWRLDDSTPDILEIRSTGAWARSNAGFAGLNPTARLELHLEGVRIELWQTPSGSVSSAHSAVNVAVDGVAHGVWNQAVNARYVVQQLPRGTHVVTISTAQPGSFTVGRVQTHVAVDYEVDALGRVVRESDARGCPTTRVFDSLDREVVVERGPAVLATTRRLSYGAWGELLREDVTWRDSSGQPIEGGNISTIYEYDFRGLLACETKGSTLGQRRRTQRRYDQRGQVSSTRNGRGVVTGYRHDDLGRRVQTTRAACSPEQSTRTYRYDKTGRKLLERSATGAWTIMGYRANGTIVSGYNSRGLIRVQTDPNGHLSVTRFDLRGQEIVVSRFGRRTDGTYELVSRIETIRDEHGDAVEKREALLSTPIPTADPIDAPDAELLLALGGGAVPQAITTFELDADGRVTRTAGPGSGVIERRYDPQGRLWDERSPDGRRTVRIYDATGNVTRIYAFEPAHAASEGASATAVFMEEYEYDALNRLLLTRDAYGNERRHEYDSAGNITLVETPDGIVTRFKHSAFGEETERVESTTATTRKRYDRSGNLVTVIDARGSRFRYVRDRLDRLVEEFNATAALPHTLHAYDRDDRLIKTVDRNGTIHTHTYDDAGHRLRTEFDWSASSVTRAALAPSYLTFEYDALGRMISHDNDWVTVRLGRDSRGLVREESAALKPATGLPPNAWQIEQTFDVAGNRTSLTYASGRSVGYTHDAASRVTEIRDLTTPSLLATFEYAGRRLRRANFPDADSTVTLSYDGRAQVVDRSVRNDIDGSISWRSQTLFDRAGRVVLENAIVEGGARSRCFGYDAHERLTSYADQPVNWLDPNILAPPARPVAPAASSAQSSSDALLIGGPALAPVYEFDLEGNRTQTAEPGGPAFTSSVDADNRYATVGSASWTHDDEGNLRSDGNITFTYDAQGALVEEFTSPGVRSVGLIRDAMGRITAVMLANSETIVYASSDRVPIAEIRADGQTEFTPGRLADEPVHVRSPDQDIWIVNDRLRTPRLLIRRGAVTAVQPLSFRPFGALESIVVPTLFDYAGLLRIPGSSLLHAFARAYRVDVGRFIQQDPAGTIDGMNRYVYARNNPLQLFDPLGWQSFSPSDERLFTYMERIAAELGLDPAHANLSTSAAGSNKHLEFQSSMFAPGSALSGEDAQRLAPEVWVNEEGVITKVNAYPNGAPKGTRTIDVAIVKQNIPGGRDSIVGMKASDALDYAVDYKTGNAELKGRRALEKLIGDKPVVKLNERGGLRMALHSRIARLAEWQLAKKMLKKKAVKKGLKLIPKALPIVGALFTYSTAEGSQGEKVARAVAGEIGIGPIDLETVYDAGKLWYEYDEQLREEDPEAYNERAEHQSSVDYTMFPN